MNEKLVFVSALKFAVVSSPQERHFNKLSFALEHCVRGLAVVLQELVKNSMLSVFYILIIRLLSHLMNS